MSENKNVIATLFKADNYSLCDTFMGIITEIIEMVINDIKERETQYISYDDTYDKNYEKALNTPIDIDGYFNDIYYESVKMFIQGDEMAIFIGTAVEKTYTYLYKVGRPISITEFKNRYNLP